MDIWGMYSPDPCSHCLREARHSIDSLLVAHSGHNDDTRHRANAGTRKPAKPTAWERMRWVPYGLIASRTPPLADDTRGHTMGDHWLRGAVMVGGVVLTR